MSKRCGQHCGIKDGYEGHCNCRMCHGTKPKIRKKMIKKMYKSSNYGKS